MLGRYTLTSTATDVFSRWWMTHIPGQGPVAWLRADSNDLPPDAVFAREFSGLGSIDSEGDASLSSTFCPSPASAMTAISASSKSSMATPPRSFFNRVLCRPIWRRGYNTRHSEEHRDAAIQISGILDCFAALAMTMNYFIKI